MSNIKNIIRFSGAVCLALSLNVAHAASTIVTASFTGTDGSTGTLHYTIDPVATGASVCGAAGPQLRNASLTITGGTIPGGSQTLGCTGLTAYICTGVNCITDINVAMNNGTVSLFGMFPFTTSISWMGGGHGTFATPTAGAAAVPAPVGLFLDVKPNSFSREVHVK